MKAAGGLYPSLGRYFPKLADLAEAGCMSRQRARDCLDGKKEFTDAEKKAIAASIAIKAQIGMRAFSKDMFFANELENALKAYNGGFEAIYRKKEG